MEKQNKEQIRYAQVRNTEGAINEEARTVQFVISTEAVDSYNTVFRLDGWVLDAYERNPIVCYNHQVFGDPDNVIGTSRVFKDGTELIGEVTFEDADTNPLAEKIFRKVQKGILRMASINATIQKARMGLKDQGEKEDVMYFTRQALQEWSIVSIGSNPDALKRNTEELDALRSAVAKDIEVDTSEERGSFDLFEAQYMYNQNR